MGLYCRDAITGSQSNFIGIFMEIVRVGEISVLLS